MQPMQRKRYTDAEKAEALELLAAVGQAEAAARTGIPVGTIKSWGARERVQAPGTEETCNAVAAKLATWADQRAVLGNRAGEIALLALEQIPDRIENRDELAAQRLASTMSALVDKAQLLTGEATERIEQLGGGSAIEAARALLDDVRERRHLRAVS